MSLPFGFLANPFAHRGLHDAANGRPENSLAAFRAAVDIGYAIELDVRLAGDGEPVVFHDGGLLRMTGAAGRVAELESRRLRDLRLSGTAETVPSLADALAAVGAAPTLVELKIDDAGLGADPRRLADAALAVIRARGANAAVMSFNAAAVMRAAHVSPDVPRGLVAEGVVNSGCEECEIDFVAIGADALIGGGAPSRNRSRPVFAWTVTSREIEMQLRGRADAVIFEGYRPAAH